VRRVPAALIAIFIVFPLFLGALVTISVSTWALDRGFYVGLVSDERLYQLPDALSAATWLPADIPGLEGLSLRSAKAAREIFTPAYLRGQAVRFLDQLFDFLEGRTAVLDMSLDTARLKSALLGEQGRRFARVFAQDLPVGGSAADFAVKPGRLPRFRPASLSVDRAAALIEAGLPTFVKSMPDTIRLNDGPPVGYAPAPWGAGFGFSARGALIFADIVLLLIAGGFWVAAAFIGGANGNERLQWLGWSLFAPALLVFILGLLITLSFFSGWVQWGIENARLSSQGFGAAFSTAVIDVARRALNRVGTGFLAVGAIAGGAALGLLAWSWIAPPEARPDSRKETGS
jgi:hypothetical protein